MKINEMFDKIDKLKEMQKSAKKEEKIKWEKQNQHNTLRNLIEKPKQFMKPKLNEIKEDSEIY